MDEASEEAAPRSEEQGRENRVLAAIVFTDAVAFSKLAGRDEQAAHAILNRDFELMTGICRAHGGRVLNTMGDGMLMCFGSAVDAMNCALKIQQALHSQSMTLPRISVLQHRIGVHLGDIIIDGTNVIGDGVNVAARLQAECKPGAICYSRMVADVIKNKVHVRGRFLGPRHLKHIAEPVPIYEVPSLSEYVTEIDPFDKVEPVPDEGGASGSRAALMVVGSMVILGLAIYAVMQMSRPKSTDGELGTSRPRPSHSAGPNSSPSPAPTQTADYRVEMAPLKQRYDFKGMLAILEGAPQAAVEMGRVRDLVAMRDWLVGEIALTTASKSIALEGGARAYLGTRGIVVESSTGSSETGFESLPPGIVLAMLRSALAAPPSGQTVPIESATWANDFSAEYNL